MLTPWVLLGLSNYCRNHVGVEQSLKCASVLQFIHQNASVLYAGASVLDQSTFSAQNAPNVWHRRGRGRGETKGTAGELSGKEGWKGREKTKGEGSCTLTEVFKSRRLCIPLNCSTCLILSVLTMAVLHHSVFCLLTFLWW